MTHHPDCDHWTNHNTYVQCRDGMYTAVCDTCGWTGSTYGKDARKVAERESGEHGIPVPCVGQCGEWS